LSFAGAWQTMHAFAALLWTASPAGLHRVSERLREVLASYRVGERPSRVEPRVRKRRPKGYPFMTEPREQARERLRK
jgi:hypothetical protein